MVTASLLDDLLTAAPSLPPPEPMVYMREADYLDLMARAQQPDPEPRVLSRSLGGGFRVDGWLTDPRRQTTIGVLYTLLAAGEAGVPHGGDPRSARKAAKRGWRALELPGDPPLQADDTVLCLRPQPYLRLGSAADLWTFSSAIPHPSTWRRPAGDS